MFDLVFLKQNGDLVGLYNQYTAQDPQSKNLCNEETPTSTLASQPFFASYPYSSSETTLF